MRSKCAETNRERKLGARLPVPQSRLKIEVSRLYFTREKSIGAQKTFLVWKVSIRDIRNGG